jgi:5-amino-6-(5-phosphoribosylamino)uracil reductase
VAVREAEGRPPHPLRVTVTATGDLDPAARFFAGPGIPLVYAVTTAAATARKNLGDKAVVIDAGADLSLAAVLADLYAERTVLTLLAEPGAVLARDLLAQDLVDEIRLAVAPFFVGDENAPRFALPAHYPHTAGNPMTLAGVRRLDGVAVLRYRRNSQAR